MTNRKLKILLCMLMIGIIFFPNPVMGADSLHGTGYSSPSPSTGGNGGGGSGGGSGGWTGRDCSGNCTKTTSCSISSYVSYYYAGIGYNAFDMYNVSFLSLTAKKEVLAGTTVGARLYEEKIAQWTASGIEVTTCECKENKPIPKLYCYYNYKKHKWNCWSYTVDNWVNYSGMEFHQTSSCTAQAEQQGYAMAKAAVETGASFDVTITDPNDARCASEALSTQEKQDLRCVNYKITPTEGTTSPPLSNPVAKKYYYEMEGACINVKTAKVRYLQSTTDTCNENEYYKANEQDAEGIHWHIFVPLNIKESDGFKIEFKANKAVIQDKLWCAAMVEKYYNKFEYMQYIKPASSNFTGVKSVDIDLVKKAGCFNAFIIKVPIVQKFYNDVKNKDNISTLDGFNFYYRPIDITNPFPNIVDEDSYWSKWSEDKKNGKEEPELSKSFEKATYSTNINEQDIREYNKVNKYTDWSTMNINGSSQFILANKNVIKNPTISSDTYYNLGCGILNECEYVDSAHKTKNPLYQPECSKVRKGDVCP